MVAKTKSTPSEPHNLEAERNVLGSCLLHADAMRDIAALAPGHFYWPKNGTIFAAIRTTHAALGLTDLITVSNELSRRDELVAIGGHEYLVELLTEVVTAVGVGHHAAIVIEKSKARSLIGMARDTLQRALDGENVDDLAAHAAQNLQALTAPEAGGDLLHALSLSDLAAIGSRPQLVDGLLHSDTLVAIVGPQKSYKTVIADSLNVGVADGTTFLGQKILEPGIACDFALEGAGGKPPRYRAQLGVARFNDTNDHVHRRLFLFTDIPDLTTTVGQDQVLRTLEALQKKTGERLRLTKWDTLARCMSRSGLDENNTKDMNSFVGGLDRIRSRLPHTQVIVHHTGVSGRERGSTVLSGAVDLLAIVNKTGASEARFTVRDARDIEVPDPWLIHFAPVVVGQYENGRPLTAMRPDSVRSVPAPQQQESGTSAARQALDDLADRVGPDGFTFKEAKEATARAKSTTSDLLKKMGFEKFTEKGTDRWRRRPQ